MKGQHRHALGPVLQPCQPVATSQSSVILCEGNKKIKQVPDIKELILCLGQTSHMTGTIGELHS